MLYTAVTNNVRNEGKILLKLIKSEANFTEIMSQKADIVESFVNKRNVNVTIVLISGLRVRFDCKKPEFVIISMADYCREMGIYI